VSHTYRFGPFSFDGARRRLARDGQSVAVPAKALDVLEVLLEHRGRTVEKDDLMGRVWPDTAVEEANLTQSIFMLRRALGDDPSNSRYISTVARRGYRFVGDATEVAAAGARDAQRPVRQTANLGAYHAYLRGRHYWSKREVDAMRAAISAFRQAIDLDPTYALAYIGLAECYLVMRVHCWPGGPDAFLMARAAAARALEIDATLAEAHAALGVIQMLSAWDWDAAGQAFRCAIELAPDYAPARNWYANWFAAQQRPDEAIREAQEAANLDPLSSTWHMGVGHMYFLARRYEDCIQAERTVLEMDPQFWLAHWALGLAYEQIGDQARAIAALRHADELSAGNLMVRGVLGRLLARCSETDEARQILNDVTGRRGSGAAPAEIAGLIHAGLEDLDAAFDCFERAAHDGSYLLSFLNVSPLFDSLRRHERFAALRRAVRLG
jgi:DNA-binding winged helix-turn-helix (wHTH) protein/Flp pilus assembly protein TadD